MRVLVAIAAGSIAFAPPAAAARAKVKVAVTCDPEGHLQSISTAREQVRWSNEAEMDDAIHRLLPNRAALLVMTNSVETPYRCIGGFIYSLQRLGYHHISFIAEPSATER